MALSKITTASLTDNAVTTDKITDANISTAKLANNAVTTAKITDANITTAKVADTAITTAKITDANITTAKIADTAITTAKITDSNITTAKVANDAITNAKIVNGERILQVVSNYNTTQTAYSATSSSGIDVLDSGTITTKETNSQFIIMAFMCFKHMSSEGTNNDSRDYHFSCLKTFNAGSGANHAYVGVNTALTRTTGNAPNNSKFYSTDVPLSYDDYSEQHNGGYDTIQRTFHVFDAPSQSAGTTVQYRIRLHAQSSIWVNRSISSTEAGGTCSLIVMEVGAN